MIIDKYSQLKIASAVLGESIPEMAAKWNVSDTHVRNVCGGDNTSARISELIDEKINEAEKKYDKHRNSKAPSY